MRKQVVMNERELYQLHNRTFGMSPTVWADARFTTPFGAGYGLDHHNPNHKWSPAKEGNYKHSAMGVQQCTFAGGFDWRDTVVTARLL